jgi:RNA polymerase sigma-70 factor (ECF subfamily)
MEAPVRNNAADTKREFESLTMPHLDELYCTAVRLTRNERDAEDLVQDTYMKAFTYFHQFQRGTNCRAWLFKILTNTFINNYRRRVKERDILDRAEVGELGTPFFSSDSQERFDAPDTAIRAELSDDVRTALEELPDDFRMVVELADLQDFSYKEIASMMGTPIGTVMSRLFRGRRMLRKRLVDFAREFGIQGQGDELEAVPA